MHLKLLPAVLAAAALAAAAPRTSRHDPSSFAAALRAARPGDTLLLRTGVYPRTVISISGEPGAPITIQAAPGARPVFDGSIVARSAWKRLRGHIYAAPSPQEPLTVIVDEAILPRVPTAEQLVEGAYAYVAGTVYVWCPRGGNPARRETGVVAQTRQRLVEISGSYVHLEGVVARFSGGSGIAVTGKHCEVRRSEVKWSAGDGLRFYRPASHGRAIGNDVHDNFCNNFVRGAIESRWGYGLGTGAGVPDCEFVGNKSYRNNGEGLGCYNQSDRTVMRGNIVYDNWSVNIYIDSVADCVVDGNIVYNTDQVRSPELRRSRPVGIMCADEVYQGGPFLKGLIVTNNVVRNCQRGFSFSRWKGAMPDSVLREALIANNTFVNNDVGISLAETLESVTIANNIVVQTNGKLCVAAPNGDVSAVKPHWTHNLVFGVEPRCFAWPKDPIDHETWLRTLAHPGSSRWADPKLDTAYHLLPGSPAIDSGTPLKQVTRDADGKPRPTGAAVDIGAYESGSEPRRR